jgi:hypothetical protein
VSEFEVVNDLAALNPVSALPRKKLTKEARDPIVPPCTEDVVTVYRRLPGLFASLIRFAAESGCRQKGAEQLR